MKRSLFFRRHLLLSILLACCIVALIVSAYLLVHRPFDSRTLPVRFSVGSSLGIELNASTLTFGRVLPGTVAEGSVFLDNPYPFPVSVETLISEDIANYVFTPQARFILSPVEHHVLPFTLAVPSTMTFGNYSGSVVFVFRRSF